MRRHSWVDWALNVAATDHGSDVARFAEAAELMRAAQRGAVTGRAGVDLRTAMTGLRDRTGELARLVNGTLADRGRAGALPEITERLAEIATSDTATEQLRAGLLAGDTGGTGDDSLGFVDVDVDTPKQPTRKQVPGSRTAPGSKRRTAPAQTPEPVADLTLERRRIERDLETAERVSQAARRDADRADTAVRHATTAVNAATNTLNQAQASLDRAQSRLQRDETDRDAARLKADAATAEVARLRAALEDAG